MDFSLRARAVEVEDVAGGLQMFLDHVPRSGAHISAYMAKMFFVSSKLRSLDGDLATPMLRPYTGRVVGDVQLALRSLGFTLDSIKDMFAHARFASHSGMPAYGLAWDAFQARIMTEGSTLTDRMDLYGSLLDALSMALRGMEVSKSDIRSLRRECTTLVQRQEPYDPHFNQVMNDGAEYPSRSNRRQSAGYFQGYYPFASPSMSPVSDEPTTPFAMPPAPEVPQSPTFSNSSQQTYSSNQTFSTNSSGNGVQHWAAKVFDGRHTRSQFPIYGSSTICYGRNEGGLIEKLTQGGYICVLEVTFSTTLVVRFYWKPHEFRTRLVYLEKDPSNGQRFRYSLPLSSINVVRRDSCLALRRANAAGGAPEEWANLRFAYYERMVLFFCVFMAMKHQDSVPPNAGGEDHFQINEDMVFSGKIHKERLVHAFRLYRDRATGCVRFEVTALRGQMTRVPIWTAFVTQYIGKADWMRLRSDGRTVALKELHPYVFCDNFTFPRGLGGYYELKFLTEQDADGFMDVFYHIPV